MCVIRFYEAKKNTSTWGPDKSQLINIKWSSNAFAYWL